MSTTKLCGNCGSDKHKFEDCPTINLQFPPTKKAYAKLEEDAGKYHKIVDEYNARWKAVVIVEQVKIFLKKSKDSDTGWYISDDVREHLQKILEGKT